jgi:nucleotide-binding universal stress UspA family protein
MRIVLAVGGEQDADAIALARMLTVDTEAEVLVANILPSESMIAAMGGAKASPTKAAEERAAAAGEALGRPFRTTIVNAHSPARGLHRVAAAHAANVLVLASSNQAPIDRALLGDVGQRVIHGSPSAVAVAPRGYAERAPQVIGRVGVAFDGTDESLHALSWTEPLARRLNAGLSLYRVFEEPPMALHPLYDTKARESALEVLRNAQREAIESTAGALPPEFRARGALLDGPVSKALAAATKDEDLFVSGSRGYGPVRSVMLGSVAWALVSHAACPVIVLPRSAQ